MKKRTNLIGLLLTVAILLFTTSCSQVTDLFSKDGVSLRDSAEVAALEAILLDKIDPETQITKIQFNKGQTDQSNFSFVKGTVVVFHVNPENPDEELAFCIDVKKKEVYKNTFAENYNRTIHRNQKANVIKASELNAMGVGQIATFVMKAVRAMESEKITANGIGSYTIYANPNPDKIEHSFAIEHIVSTTGRMINYEDYKFKVILGDGELKQS